MVFINAKAPHRLLCARNGHLVQGLASSAPAAEQQPSEDAWGFATRVPALDLLFARAQQATASTDSLQPISGHVTSAKGTPDQLKHHKSGRKCERVHQACLESSDLQLGLLCRLSGSFACQSHFPVPRLRPGNGRSVRHAVPAVIPAGQCSGDEGLLSRSCHACWPVQV